MTNASAPAPASARRRTKPDFPARETALLWVGSNRSMGVRMALTGVALSGLMGYRCFVSHGAALWIAIIFTPIALLLALIGLRLATRRDPMLAADEQALVASTVGSDRSRIPWELISGAAAVGSPKRSLVILTDDLETALKHVDPAVLPTVRRQNQKLAVSGALHIPGNMLGTPPEIVALRVHDIIGVPAPAMETAGEPAART